MPPNLTHGTTGVIVTDVFACALAHKTSITTLIFLQVSNRHCACATLNESRKLLAQHRILLILGDWEIPIIEPCDMDIWSKESERRSDNCRECVALLFSSTLTRNKQVFYDGLLEYPMSQLVSRPGGYGDLSQAI